MSTNNSVEIFKSITIRKANLADGEKIHLLINRSIAEICAPFYSSEALAHWNGKRTLEKISAWIEREDLYFLVAESAKISETPESKDCRSLILGTGFISLKTGILHACYVHPNYMGLGIGKLLMSKMIEAGKNSGHKNISLRATLNAESFYAKLGFETTARFLDVKPPADVPHIKMLLDITPPVGALHIKAPQDLQRN